MDAFKNVPVLTFNGDAILPVYHDLIVEEPLVIRIEGKPYSVVMRTPGNEISHVAGFCLAEGLISSPDDIETIGFCTDEDSNVATVTLQRERKKKVAHLLERKGFVSQTSCGICGKELVQDLKQILHPVKDGTSLPVNRAINCFNRLTDVQDIYKKTRAAHGALLFDSQLKVISFAEDVGRHNALDKVIGHVFMAGQMDRAVIALMSSRLSYELVQKAARAQLTFLFGVSRPTSLAVELGASLNMTLACLKKNDLMIFCGGHRLTGPK